MRDMRTVAIASMLAILGFQLASFDAAAQTELVSRGRVLARGLCGGCHAIAKTGDSPHVAAPRFRELDRRLDLDKFARRMREGLLTAHHDMPMFRFSRDDADAMVAYLRTVQGP